MSSKAREREKNREHYKTFRCTCPNCSRKFSYTFKFSTDKLLIGLDGNIEWRCFKCEKESVLIK